MKKIVFCVPSLEFGGAERVTVRLAKQFALNYKVYIITTKKAAEEYKLTKDIERINLTNPHFIGRAIEFRKIIKKIHPEFLITMFAPMYVLVHLSLMGTNMPTIVSERNDPKKFAGKSIVKILYQYFLKKADGVVFQTKEARDYYIKRKHILNTIIYNPICAEEIPAKFSGVKKKTIVNIGRLHYQKNHKLLIDAFCDIHDQIKEFNLIIYGEGPLYEELNNYILNRNASNYITLYGKSDDVLNEIKDKYMFVLSSDFEGMPNALIEAMCLGLPVISTDCPCGGPAELIEDRKNGLLVRVGDKKQLSKAILELALNPQFASELGKSAYETRRILDINKIAKQWLQFCEFVKENKKK